MEHCHASTDLSGYFTVFSISAMSDERPRYPLPINPRFSVESSVPDLITCQHRTTSSALHDRLFTGDLRPWPNFLADVETTHRNHVWRRKVLGYKLKVRDPYEYANSEVGEEAGVQSRFQKFIGDVLNAIFKSQSINLGFSDWKCVPSNYSGKPDGAIKTANPCVLKVVGELKVHWVEAHCIDDALEDGDQLKELLAQPIMYMQDLGCMYGFLGNYNETIFLRQVMDTTGVWRIEYSPVILSTSTYAPSMNPPVVSVKQCFFHVCCRALHQGPVNNTTPEWVVEL